MNRKINAVLAQTLSLNPKHFETLIGERPYGSQWGKEITRDDLEAMDWQEVPNDQPGMLPFCMYFYVTLPEDTTARQVCERSSTFKAKDLMVEDGPHGKCLTSDLVTERECTEAWLIVGPAQDAKGFDISGQFMVWTCFPGDLMPPLPQDWDGDVSTLDLSQGYAVKGR